MLGIILALWRLSQSQSGLDQVDKYKSELRKIEKIAKQYGQEHLFRQMNLLTTEQQLKKFYDKVKQIDFKLMKELYQNVYLKSLDQKASTLKQNEYSAIDQKLPLDQQSLKEIQRLEALGLQAIARGEVCVITMAGGQGTRLGFDHPKGMFDLKLQQKKTLFQIFAERILSLEKLARQKYPKQAERGDLINWFVMTSDATDSETRKFFEEKNYFGLKKNNVHFFVQASFPSIDLNGKIILQDSNEPFLAPNGNGGLFLAIAPYINFFQKNHIKYLHIMGVDNSLVKMADPLMVGYSIDKNLQIVSKYVAKRDAHESVGIHLLENKKIIIMEYSDMPESMKVEMKEDNTLKYSEAFICTLLLRLDLLEYVISNFSKCSLFHQAVKKIEYYDLEKQAKVKPTECNGVKFEMFIFDIFAICDNKQFGLLEVKREEEFAPLKNNAKDSKSDTEETARELLCKQHMRWLNNIGFRFNKEAGSNPEQLCEIDFTITYNGENLERFAPKYKEESDFTSLPFYLK